MSVGNAPHERDAARALDRHILDLVAVAQQDWFLPDDALTAAAAEIFAYQCRYQPALAGFAAARGVDPQRLADWRELPPVPTRAFKTLRLATFSPEHTVRVFRSSGTTLGTRSELELDSMALYDAALLPTFAHYVLPDGARLDWLALLSDPEVATDSSLAYMVGRAAAEFATDVAYTVDERGLDVAATRVQLAGAEEGRRPLCILGTAFAFVHLLDALAASGRRYRLAPGSRIVETGGLKGRSRAVSKSDLYTGLVERLGVPFAFIVSEYGMTEMGSQYYDIDLRAALGVGGATTEAAERRLKAGPPWARARVVDPATLALVPDGADGVLLHFDLTGRSSTLAILTEDLARRRDDRFELIGRMPGAEPRGCSLAFEEILRRAAES